LDPNDTFPGDAAEWKDTDYDGKGDNADLDDDGDGYSDFDEMERCLPHTDHLDYTDSHWIRMVMVNAIPST